MPTISPAVAVRVTLEKPSPEMLSTVRIEACRRRPGRASGGNVESSCRPTMSASSFVVADRVDVGGAAQLAVAQHGDPIGERADLGQAVGDVDDGAAASGRRADETEEQLDAVPPERCGGFVEDQQPR